MREARSIRRLIPIALPFLASAALCLVALPPAQSLPAYLQQFNAEYGTSGTKLDGCATCHTGSPSRQTTNSYAQDFAAANHDFAAIEGLDSDGDGFSNLDEINARTFPGDPQDKPNPSPAPAPAPTPTTTAPTTTATPPPTAPPTTAPPAQATPSSVTTAAPAAPTTVATAAPSTAPTAAPAPAGEAESAGEDPEAQAPPPEANGDAAGAEAEAGSEAGGDAGEEVEGEAAAGPADDGETSGLAVAVAIGGTLLLLAMALLSIPARGRPFA